MHLGEVIKKYRYEHGKMSMQAFADKCGLSKGYIAMLERNVNSKTGEPVIPSVETFLKVAKAMNITLDELTKLVDENQPISLQEHDLAAVGNSPLPSNILTPAEQSLLTDFRQLNDEGQDKVCEYTSDLVASGRYNPGAGDSAGSGSSEESA